RLDDNGNGKANYWLQYNHLLISHQGKHQKTVRLIDDEDIAEKCHTWIRSQSGTTTPLKFKEFVEEKLLVNSGILKKKTISIATAACWLNVLRYSFQSQK
ncbi:876_t:CDS:2, partial [Funneliformis geosporum]